MKKKFNIYCVFLLIATALATTLPHLYPITLGVIDGWTEATSEEAEMEVKGVLSGVQLLPKKHMMIFNDSIYNNKTQQMEGIQIMSAMVNSPSSQIDTFTRSVLGVLGLVKVVVIITFIVLFIKIILSVNRGEIFDVMIEKRLSKCGWLFIAYYFLDWGLIAINYIGNVKFFDFENYLVTISDTPGASIIIAGIGMLLISQIFTMARKMKEEQELTI